MTRYKIPIFNPVLVAELWWPLALIPDISGLFLPIVASFAGLFITFSLTKYLIGSIDIPVTDLTKHHNWKNAKILAQVIRTGFCFAIFANATFLQTLYCSICESMLLNGFGLYCDCCGVCSDRDCVKIADKTLPCKTNEVFSENMEHHWVKGIAIWILCESLRVRSCKYIEKN